MRTVPAIVSALLLAATAVHPCSEIYAGRTGVTLGPAVRPASILILQSPGLQMHAALLKSTLKQLGHRVREVDTMEQVTSAMEDRKGFDIVMADLPEALVLCEQLSTTESKTVVLPLLRQASDQDTDRSQACAQGLVLSSKSSAVQSTIRTALEDSEQAEKN